MLRSLNIRGWLNQNPIKTRRNFYEEPYQWLCIRMIWNI